MLAQQKTLADDSPAIAPNGWSRTASDLPSYTIYLYQSSYLQGPQREPILQLTDARDDRRDKVGLEKIGKDWKFTWRYSIHSIRSFEGWNKFHRTFDPPNPVLLLIAPRLEGPSPRSSYRAAVGARLFPKNDAPGIRSQSYATGAGRGSTCPRLKK